MILDQGLTPVNIKTEHTVTCCGLGSYLSFQNVLWCELEGEGGGGGYDNINFHLTFGNLGKLKKIPTNKNRRLFSITKFLKNSLNKKKKLNILITIMAN